MRRDSSALRLFDLSTPRLFGVSQWHEAQLPDEQPAQLEPTDFVAPPSPLVRAANTDMMRLIFPAPQIEHFRPFPLLPMGQRRSVTVLHFSHRNSYRGTPPPSEIHAPNRRLTIALG